MKLPDLKFQWPDIPFLKPKPKKRKGYALSLYFGIPGAGKTTMAAYLSKTDMKKGRKVYSNVPITGTMKVDKADIGHTMLCDGRLIWDEAGLDYDNRKMKMTAYHDHQPSHEIPGRCLRRTEQGVF